VIIDITTKANDKIVVCFYHKWIRSKHKLNPEGDFMSDTKFIVIDRFISKSKEDLQFRINAKLAQLASSKLKNKSLH